MTYANLGEKPKEGQEEEEKEWRTPLDTKRTNADSIFLAAFSIFVGFWFLTGIYVYLVDDTIQISYSKVLHRDRIFMFSSFLIENCRAAKWLVLGFMMLSVLLLLGFIAMFRWFTKLLVFATVFLTSAVLLLFYGFSLGKAHFNLDNKGPERFLNLVPLTLLVVLHCVIIRAFRNVGSEPVCKVIRMSCKAIFYFPCTVFVSLIQFAIHLLVIGFATGVFLLLREIKNPEVFETTNMTSMEPEDFNEIWDEKIPEPDDQIINIGQAPNYALVCLVVNVLGALWIYNFFAGLGRMILTTIFATWYYTEDKRRMPKRTVPRSVNLIFKYHLGTVAYGSSLFTVFPMTYIIFRHGRDKLREMCREPSCLLSWLTIIAKFSFDALGICAIHGEGFYKSAKESYILLMKNPLSFLTINFISECVIFVGLLLLPVTAFFGTLGYVCLDGGCEGSLHSVHVTFMFVVTVTSALMSLTFFAVFRAASNTIRYCYLHDSKFQESEMNMYEIHIDETSKMNDIFL